MYSGITQVKMAELLFMSEAKYNRKEKGLSRISRDEAIRIAELLELNEQSILKYWMADQLYELIKQDKDLVYEALDLVESHFENYETCVEMPSRNSSFSSLDERIKHRKKK